MALDTGSSGSAFDGAQAASGADLYSDSGADAPRLSVEALAFAPGVHFGAGLKAARESLGFDLARIADATKIRRHYLASLEAMDLAQLPSRPFILGYVRAYARVLGLDEERAIARFRQDAPDPNEPLRAPVGVSKIADPRFGLLAAAAGMVIAAIVVWNVAQRAMAKHEADPATEAATMVPDFSSGPVTLGEPLPPPQESTLPDPYITPGLSGEVTGVQPAAPPTGPLEAPKEVRPFVAKGGVYGADAANSQIVIQARRSGALIARGGDGKVYFAQQLQAGEAYRAPMLPGLVIDVSSPQIMDVFIAGVLAGNLVQPITPLSALAKALPPPPAAPAESIPAPAAALAPTAPAAPVE